jgi:hypothetical protein
MLPSMDTSKVSCCIAGNPCLVLPASISFFYCYDNARVLFPVFDTVHHSRQTVLLFKTPVVLVMIDD